MRGDHSLATKVHSYRRADDQVRWPGRSGCDRSSQSTGQTQQ
jgi:hypothetical protein